MRSGIRTAVACAVAVAVTAAPAPAQWWKKKIEQAVGGLPNPVEDAAKKAEELRKKAEEEARKQAEKAAEAAKVKELQRKVEDARRKFKELDAKAKKAKDIAAAVNDLNSPHRPTRERAYATLRRENALKTNKADVERRHRAGGAFVVYGVELDHYDQKAFAAAVVASVASGNPGPVLAYLKQLATETAARVARGLDKEEPAVRDRVRREFNLLLVKAFDNALKGDRPAKVDVPRVHLEVGVAAYNNWVDLVYDEPRLVPTQKVLGVQLYEVRTERRQQKLKAPNTHQPYAMLRVGPVVQ